MAVLQAAAACSRALEPPPVASPLQAMRREIPAIPLRVGVHIGDDVLKFTKYMMYHNHPVGRHLADTVNTQFAKTFTSVRSLPQYPLEASALQDLDCVVVLGKPSATGGGFNTTVSVTVPFTVFLPSGARVFESSEVNTTKLGATGGPSSYVDGWFQMADSDVADFLEKFGQSEFARKASSSLRIVSHPGSAQVYLDEKLAGSTGASGELVLERLSPGVHRVRVAGTGYLEWSQSVTLTGGQTTELEAKLLLPFGELTLETTPGGGQVYVDDVYKGTTSEQGRLRLDGVAPGSHRLRLASTGYQEWTQKTEVTAGQTLPLKVTLESSGPKPLQEPEIEDGLTKGLPNARLVKLVKEFGVAFTLTPQIEQRLRRMGANNDLLLAIATHKK